MSTYVYYDPNKVPPAGAGYMLRVTENADGSWSSPVAVTINGSTTDPFVDPNITVLANGTYLLAYTTLLPNSGGTPQAGVAIQTAISTDGLNFTDGKPAFAIASNVEVSDPSIVQLANGSFLMSVGNFGHPGTNAGVSFYTSQDGRNYTPTGVTFTQSDISPDLVLLSDGSVRLYTSGFGGVVSFISHDSGATWTKEAGLRLPAATGTAGLISVVQSDSSQWEMVVQALIDPFGPSNPSNAQLVLATSTDGLNFTITQNGFVQKAGSPEIVATPPFNPLTGPVVVSLSAVSDTNTAYASTGHVVTITLTLSEPVTVTGAPTLLLNDHGTATYVGSSGGKLTFSHTVSSDNNTTDLQVTSLNVPFGASISDQLGHTLTAVTGDLGMQINTTTVQQEIAGLYVTLYGLASTQAGLNYWTNVLSAFDPSITAGNAASTAMSLNAEIYLGQQMTAGSPVVNGTTYFQTLYPASMTDLAYVKALYQNMSGFVGTAAGDQFWFTVMLQAEAANGGNVTLAREAIVGQFTHDFYGNDLTVGAAALGVSASDYALLVAGQQTLHNRVTVAQFWASETAVPGGDILNFTSVTDPSFVAAQHVLLGITSDPNTVTVAITGITNAVMLHDLHQIT
jgi:hypothetical protein